MILDKEGNKIGKENIKEVILRMDSQTKNETDNAQSKNSTMKSNKTEDASSSNKSASTSNVGSITSKDILKYANITKELP